MIPPENGEQVILFPGKTSFSSTAGAHASVMVKVGVVMVGEQLAPTDGDDELGLGVLVVRLGVVTVGEQSATQPG